MTTNQTIDGVLVPRKLLSYWAECLESAGFKDRPAEMRALLGAPAKDYVMINNMYFSHAEILKWREKACMELEAAPPQGEPVAWQYRVSAGPQTGWSLWHDGKGEEFKQSYQVETRPLYAEHPASVAPQKYDDTLLPFVELMRKELHANAGKGDRPGWLSMSSDTCLLEIIYHFGKLQASVKRGDGDGMAEYGADVANLCMMLLDICGVINLVQHAEQPAPVAAAQTCCGSCPGGCVYGLKA